MEEEDNQKDKYEDMTNNETGAQGVRDENVRHSYVITHAAQINMNIFRSLIKLLRFFCQKLSYSPYMSQKG